MSLTIDQLQPKLVAHFTNLIKNNRLAHAYLLTGPAGVGKLALAKYVAQSLLCLQPQDGKPCLQCRNCQRIAADDHPDVVAIAASGRQIKVDQIRYLQAEFAKSGMESARKIFIINDAEKMTAAAANSLLKFLEEPNGTITAFLLSGQPSRLLPTIVSRCQLCELQRLPHEQVVQLVAEHGINAQLSSIVAALSEDVNAAVALANDDNFQKQLAALEQWFTAVVKGDLISDVLVQSKLLPTVTGYSDQQRLLELIILICKDAMMAVSAPDYQPIFADWLQANQAAVQRIGAARLAQGTNVALKSWRWWQANMAYANVLEAITLQLNAKFQQ